MTRDENYSQAESYRRVTQAFARALGQVQQQFPQLRGVAIVPDWYPGAATELRAIRGFVVDTVGDVPDEMVNLPEVRSNLVGGLVGLATHLTAGLQQRFNDLQLVCEQLDHKLLRSRDPKEGEPE